jgi:2-polyprenyl-3-methyl-5-hydroxy-6-metoxy-1,4-benzoquinol methylase
MSYYHFIRSEIEPLLPKDCSRVLEVGAGAGETLRWLKTKFPGAQTTGVEINAALTSDLKRNADIAITGGIDECSPLLGSYDLILFLDVLEHLVDPGGTLARVSKLLEPGGHVIVSVPNIAHFSVSLPLLLRRRFTYQDAGILDRTHLRFFVEDTAVKLLNDASFVVKKGLITGFRFSRGRRWLDCVSFGLLRHHLAVQYIMLGELTKQPPVQKQISWAIAE